MHIAPWHVIVATVAVSAVAVSGVGAVGVQEFQSAQTIAVEQAQLALAHGDERIELATQRIADLEMAISNAEDILESSEGKTSDESVRKQLQQDIAEAKKLLADQKTELYKLKTAVRALSNVDVTGFFWPGSVNDDAVSVEAVAGVNTEKVVRKVSSVGESIKAVQSAQAQWQAEQDRIAAEKAAAEAAAEVAKRMAAPRKITQTSTVTSDGGATAPSAPAPPATQQMAAPVTAGFSVESYVAALAPNSYISWVDGLCTGYYVCGRAWVGGVNSTPVKIELDGLLRDIYANPVGISVLVHEAAHARQWFSYGASIITTSEQQSGLPGVSAVEYMADCATIGKLGYSTGTYTRSCTADQLGAIASIW